MQTNNKTDNNREKKETKIIEEYYSENKNTNFTLSNHTLRNQTQ